MPTDSSNLDEQSNKIWILKGEKINGSELTQKARIIYSYIENTSGKQDVSWE
jgi:hypothetical protein